jgi:ribosomal protein L11 methylase PrmA
MQKKHSAAAASPERAQTASASLSTSSLTNIIESLAGIIRKLEYKAEGTEWADYYAHTNYTDAALEQKTTLVRQMIERVSPSAVWDLGANTGYFSRLASRAGIPTVAFDMDPAAVERNYHAVKAEGEANLLPLIMDLTNPSPNLGWAGEERRSIVARGPVDLAMALALIHHLAIGNNVPLADIARFLARVGRHVIIEFVPKEDSQVHRLLATRPDVFPEYTELHFREAFGRLFSIEQATPIPNTRRTLYLMRLRS